MTEIGSYQFEVEPPRLSVSRLPRIWRGGGAGEASYYSISVTCPCCGERNHVGSIVGHKGAWQARWNRTSWSESKRLRRKPYKTVNAAVEAILRAKGLPPRMWRA
jgi:hypothetical protein